MPGTAYHHGMWLVFSHFTDEVSSYLKMTRQIMASSQKRA